MATECAAFHEQYFKEHADSYGPVLRSYIEPGLLVPGVRYLQAQRMRTHFREEMTAVANRVDALLTPSTHTPAPRDLTTTGDPIFQSPWTSAGMPTVTIPSGRCGLWQWPTGVRRRWEWNWCPLT